MGMSRPSRDFSFSVCNGVFKTRKRSDSQLYILFESRFAKMLRKKNIWKTTAIFSQEELMLSECKLVLDSVSGYTWVYEEGLISTSRNQSRKTHASTVLCNNNVQRVYENCNPHEYSGRSYRYGWLEDFRPFSGNLTAIVDAGLEKIVSVVPDELHGALFLAGYRRGSTILLRVSVCCII
ncbi:hypothetical protein COOONC_21980 [Cooperia oncophora]